MNDKEIITNIYKELWDASIKKDNQKLNELLADNYVLIHMTGLHQTKEDYINSVLKEELKYENATHESIEIKIDGDKAYLIGKTKTLASPFGIPKSTWNLRQDIVLEKRNNTWKIISSKASSY